MEQHSPHISATGGSPPAGGRHDLRALISAAKYFVTIGAIALLLFSVDRSALLQRLRHISLLDLAVALAIGISQVLLVGYRWWRVARFFREPSAGMPALKQFQLINYAGQLVGQMLPFLAADALRIAYARAAGLSLRSAVVSTAFDRGIALLSLLGLCEIALTLSPTIGNIARLRVTVTVFAILSLTGGAAILAFGDKAAARLPDTRLCRGLADLIVLFRRILLDVKVAVPILCLALLIHGMSIGIFWLLCVGQGLAVNMAELLVIVPPLILASALPISVAGWGVREGIAVALFAAIGIPADAALAVSLSFGSITLLAAVPGAATMMMLPKSRTSS